MTEQETMVKGTTLREVYEASGAIMVATENVIQLALANKTNPEEMKSLIALGHIAHSVAYEMWRLVFNLANPEYKVK